MSKFKIALAAEGEDAWKLLDRLQGVKQGRIVFSQVTINGCTVKGEIMALILTNTQECDLAIQPLDARGNPAQVDGVPAWSVSDATKASLVIADDGLSCVVKAVANGACQVSVSADADLGAGIRTLTGILDLEIVSGEAVTLGIIAGTPRQQVI